MERKGGKGLTSLSPGKLPKVRGAWGIAGARWPPPLCWGICGMGEGECAGDWILGLPLPGMGMGAAPPIWGVLWAIAGDSLKPNWMFL